MYALSLFIFRRDLRLEDNTALIKVMAESKQVLPCFIFDPRQIEEHPFRSDFALRFMLDSLEQLQQELLRCGGELFLFQGKAEDIIKHLLKDIKIDAVYVNRDYTPFSITRDLAIKELCLVHKVDFISSDDALLHSPNNIRKPDGGVYTVYTPFYNKASQSVVNKPQAFLAKNFYKKNVLLAHQDLIETLKRKFIKKSIVPSGRVEALKVLDKIKQFADYDNARNLPAIQGTTYLSAHHKFGTVSIREVYWAIAKVFGQECTLIKELYWRDFFTHIAYHFPHVFGHAFYEEYDAIKWSFNQEHFDQWCQGKTGFPIVDAGMRQLNQTGYMHNRVRMITASFLVKDLHIDWRLGEAYFARYLVDYDPCVNNGNWQWAASTGCDKQPYFRIFNPWLQGKKFDPQANYIKQWVFELKNVAPDDIHAWHERYSPILANYPSPIIDHQQEKEITLAMFKSIKQKDE